MFFEQPPKLCDFGEVEFFPAPGARRTGKNLYRLAPEVQRFFYGVFEPSAYGTVKTEPHFVVLLIRDDYTIRNIGTRDEGS